MSLDATIIAQSDVALLANAVFREAPFQVGITASRKTYSGRAMIRGMWNSDVAGRLDIYQCFNAADAATITNGAPAAGTGDAITVLSTFPFASAGAAEKGQPFFVPIVAPFVVVRYTNGAAPQTKFRLLVEVVE